MSCPGGCLVTTVVVMTLGSLCQSAPRGSALSSPGADVKRDTAAAAAAAAAAADWSEYPVLEENVAQGEGKGVVEKRGREAVGEGLKQQDMLNKAFLCVPSMPACVEGKLWAEFRCFQEPEQCVCMCPVGLKKVQRHPVLPLSTPSHGGHSRRNVRNIAKLLLHQ